MSETVLFASWLEPAFVQMLSERHPGVRFVYEPDLLRPPRYPADHLGAELERTPEEKARWLELLGAATILFDFDRTHIGDLPERASGVRWIQATSAGIGQFVRRQGYAERMPETVFTTASGVHAAPLAEFAIMSMLMHVRQALHTVRAQGTHTWERFAGSDLEGRTVVIVGLGAIGGRVAGFARALGMRVVATRRRPTADYVGSAHEVHGPGELLSLLPRADYLVLVAPHTDDTEHLIDAGALATLPRGAALINIGRGALVDEAALVESLRSGHLGGAYLDVFEVEPLPQESPLWDFPNVLVCPHSGSTSDRENERIVDLFSDNLTRWLTGTPLRNVLDTEALY